MLPKNQFKQPFEFLAVAFIYAASNAQTITVLRSWVYWRMAWNTTYKPFWRFLFPRRFASRLGFGHAAV